jgi:two-component system, response regulator RegA
MLQMQILIVDDDADYAEILAAALTRRGCRVAHAGTLANATALATQTRFDGIVLDLRLAHENGLTLIAPLRAIDPTLRILLLTGYASIATAVEAIKLGATHYLAKPASADEIIKALGRDAGDPQTSPPDTPMRVDQVEWEHLQRVLNEWDGNISAAARALKMHRRTLQRKLNKRPSPG